MERPELDLDDEPEADEPEERLSWLRVLILLAAVGVLAAAGVFALRRSAADNVASVERSSWSIPYVDVTLTPTYEFQNPQVNPARDVALAFVVADPANACTPSWGGAYTMDEASRDLELDRRITRLRAAGGDIMVSFGGQANTELAYACTDEAKLTKAYHDVVERYDVQSIDLDIENADIADVPSIDRRARAIAAVQDERAAAGHELAVWITLPVATTGLTPDGVALVTSTIAGGVELTGVNAMTMNFGSAEQPTKDMLAATTSALEATASQIATIYRRTGVTLSDDQTWARIGATPMIGQNDIDGEIFTLGDAQGLTDFATSKGLGRVSLWSLNRDAPCDAAFADVAILSNTCSGQVQEALAFANVFTSLTGRAGHLSPSVAVTVPDQQESVDDATTSPYPLWRPNAEYPEGFKVVRRGIVYQAKWYNTGTDPSADVGNPGEMPWTLIGPIGPGDKPFTLETLAPGTYPDWDPKQLYAKGDTVLFSGLPYEARWPNQAEAPETLFPVGPDSAWEPRFAVPGEPDDS